MEKNEVKKLASRRKKTAAKKAPAKKQEPSEPFVITAASVRIHTEVVNEEEDVLDRLTQVAQGFNMTVERAIELGLITVTKGSPIDVKIEKAKVTL